MKKLSSAFLLLAAVILSACESKEKSTPVPIPPLPTDFGYLRVVNNLTPTGGFFDTYNNTQLKSYSENIGKAAAMGKSAAFVQVPIGEPFVVVALTDFGQRVGSSLAQGQVKIEKDQFYSFFTYYANPFYITGVEKVVLVKEPNMPAPAAGKAYVRIINLGTEEYPVKIEEPFGEVLYPDVKSRQVTDYQVVDGRIYTLKVSRTTGDERELFTQSVTVPSEFRCSLVIRGSSEKNAQGRGKINFDLIYD